MPAQTIERPVDIVMACRVADLPVLRLAVPALRRFVASKTIHVFTKAALVDGLTGELLGTASHRTTIPDGEGNGDVLDGLDACRSELAVTHPAVVGAEVLACSSAGGGLRIAVLGNEQLVTAEAGRPAALGAPSSIPTAGT